MMRKIPAWPTSTRKHRLFAQLGSHSDRQNDFVSAFADATAAGIELNFNLRRFALEEDFRCIRHFNGKILDVELFNTEDGLFVLFHGFLSVS
jgi:hypothetical protein